MVEAQHVASTMKLVDNAAEQDLLEALLDDAKPALPPETRKLDYLLASPFRYPPYPTGSRFRGATDPGVFYGAGALRTSCAELGYWRWRFLSDSPALQQIGPVAHTAFSVRVRTDVALDLRAPPLAARASDWMAAHDYRATQQLAREARSAGLTAIVYRSVRDPEPGWCAALLGPQAFAARRPEPAMQSWWLLVRRDEVRWRRETESLQFAASIWA